MFVVMSYSNLNLDKMFNELVLTNFKAETMTILTYNIICAVNFMHSIGVMHRDLRPANILLNNHCEVTIFNFGSARDIVPEDTNVLHV